MAKREIKAGDRVYAPHFSAKAMGVRLAEMKSFGNPNKFKAVNEYGDVIFFDEWGMVIQSNICPLVFLVSEENREKIKALYGVEMEIPAAPEANYILDLLNEKLLELIEVSKHRDSKDHYRGLTYERAQDKLRNEILDLFISRIS